MAAKSRPQTWLTSIVRNRCLDLLRRRDLDTMTLTRDNDEGRDRPAGDRAHPGRAADRRRGRAMVRDCVDALEGGQKQAIALAFFQGLSHAELAASLREPLGTVKSWVRRGLERLKSCLERAGMTGYAAMKLDAPGPTAAPRRAGRAIRARHAVAARAPAARPDRRSGSRRSSPRCRMGACGSPGWPRPFRRIRPRAHVWAGDLHRLGYRRGGVPGPMRRAAVVVGEPGTLARPRVRRDSPRRSHWDCALLAPGGRGARTSDRRGAGRPGCQAGRCRDRASAAGAS